MTDIEKLHTASPDGGDSAITDERIILWKAELDTMRDSMANGLGAKRVEAEEARFCEWQGMSPDGRKWNKNHGEEQVEPFDGSTDSRIRLVDEIVNERKKLKVLAALRSSVRALPLGKDDDMKAARVEALLKYVINRWGSNYIMEISRLADYVEGDEPAAAMLGVYWHREWAMRYEDVTLDSLLEKYIEWIQMESEGVDDLEQKLQLATKGGQALRDSVEYGLEDGVAEMWLGQFYPHLTEARIKKTIKELRENLTTSFPIRTIVKDEPRIIAHRLYEEAFVSPSVRNLNDTPHYFISELVTKNELLSRIATQNYSKAWVDKVINVDPEGTGGTARNLMGCIFMCGYERAASGVVQQQTFPFHYQIFHTYFHAVNADFVSSKYCTTFHYDVEGSAYGAKLLPYPHGGYPAVLFVREAISPRSLDSRGVSSIVAPSQGLLKLSNDTTGDVAQFALPPVISIGKTTAGKARLKPLEDNKLKRGGELKFMQPPSAVGTSQNDQWSTRIIAGVDSYFGRPATTVPQQTVAAHQEYDMLLWLAQLKDVFRMVIQYCQIWMPETELKKILDDDGKSIIDNREDISGEYDVEVTFAPRELDMEFLKAKMDLYATILGTLDTNQTVERNAIVSRLMYSIDSGMASVSVQSITKADVREGEDEQLNFLKIAAGVPVEAKEDGQNFMVRLQVLQGIAQSNPASIQMLAPERQEAFLQRMEHLEFMVKQKGENAQAGRVGVNQGVNK